MTLKRKLLSSIIGLSTLPLFPIAITSCSKPGNGDIYDYSDPSKPLPNISNELNDKLNGLWEEKNSTIEKGLYTTKLATSLENKLISSNTTKTEEEVQNIADQKFKNLTESELKEYLVNNLNITSHKQYLDEATSSGFKKEVNLSTSRKYSNGISWI